MHFRSIEDDLVIWTPVLCPKYPVLKIQALVDNRQFNNKLTPLAFDFASFVMQMLDCTGLKPLKTQNRSVLVYLLLFSVQMFSAPPIWLRVTMSKGIHGLILEH